MMGGGMMDPYGPPSPPRMGGGNPYGPPSPGMGMSGGYLGPPPMGMGGMGMGPGGYGGGMGMGGGGGGPPPMVDPMGIGRFRNDATFLTQGELDAKARQVGPRAWALPWSLARTCVHMCVRSVQRWRAWRMQMGGGRGGHGACRWGACREGHGACRDRGMAHAEIGGTHQLAHYSEVPCTPSSVPTHTILPPLPPL